MSTGSSDGSSILPIFFFAAVVGVPVCWLHGVYLAFHEGFLSFLLAAFIPPWGFIKGLIGFF